MHLALALLGYFVIVFQCDISRENYELSIKMNSLPVCVERSITEWSSLRALNSTEIPIETVNSCVIIQDVIHFEKDRTRRGQVLCRNVSYSISLPFRWALKAQIMTEAYHFDIYRNNLFLRYCQLSGYRSDTDRIRFTSRQNTIFSSNR